ncbi:LacI family DNA-binding transcriptional regulator [Streptococcus hongkongensis]|nr:LacI family transcriptional regulator [Streptococcus uberis]
MVTIKDVARLAGVSPSTASRAMHDNEMISQSTKDRVKKVMEELNYSPNYSAQNLVKRRNNTVGIILPVRESHETIGDNPFFMQIIQGISGICTDKQQMVALATGRTEEDLLANVTTMIRSGNISKFIFLYSKAEDPVYDFIAREKVDCVVVGHSLTEKRSDQFQYIDNDNRQAGYDASQYLLNKGYSQITYIYNDMDEMVQAERYSGFANAMKEKGKIANSFNMSLADAIAFQSYLQENPAQAFVTCDDILAIKLQKLLRESGQQADKKAIISFNNSIIAQIATPSLTSVEIFPYKLGEAAAQAILAEKKLKDEVLVIPHKIIERASTQES